MKHDRQRGFTLIEVSIILMVLVILAAILVPSIGGFNALARGVRLKEDLGSLCSMMKMMLDDIGASAFFQVPYAGSRSYGVSYGYGAGTASATASGSVQIEQTTEQVDDWCTNCDMPRADCGSCRNDCDDSCGRPSREPITAITTQTYRYQSNTAAYGPAAGYAGSAGSAGLYVSGGYANSSYGYAAGYGTYGWPIGLLVGAGDVPATAIGPTEWQLPVGATFQELTHGRFPVTVAFRVGVLDDQLIHYDPTYYAASYAGGGYAGAYGQRAAYGNGSYAAGYGLYSQYNRTLDTRRFFRWRGPYLADRVSPDPWGNRYMANVFGLHVPPPHLDPTNLHHRGRHIEQFASAVVCYSAGPDEQIETVFNQPWGWFTGGDDVTAVLAGAGGIR